MSILIGCLLFGACSKQEESTVSQTNPAASKLEFTRATALSVLQGRISKVVQANMSGTSKVYGNPDLTDLFSTMIADGIIVCRQREPESTGCGCWIGCSPGPNSPGFTRSSEGGMYLTIGHKIPSEVTGITKIDQATALADFVLTYKPESDLTLFNKYFAAFNTRFGIDDRDPETHRAVFRLFDDGWRLESWN